MKTTILGFAPAVTWSSFAMHRLVRKIRWSMYACRNRLYLGYEKCMARLSRGKSLRILLSDTPEWPDGIKNDLKRGITYTRHEVHFGTVSPQSFAKNDLVVPWVLSDLRQFHQWPQLMVKNPIPVPSEEIVSLCDDKYRFGQTLIEKGFGSYIPSMEIGPDEFPYILKKRVGVFGKECWIIRDRSDQSQVFDQLNDPAYFRQEIVRGSREFATHILFANGRIVKSLNIMYEFESEIPIKGQDDWGYRVIHRCPYLGLFADILRSIRFQGLCCLNYKVARGRPYIFEINPRFGGSLAPYFFSFIRHLEFATEIPSTSSVPDECLREGGPRHLSQVDLFHNAMSAKGCETAELATLGIHRELQSR